MQVVTVMTHAYMYVQPRQQLFPSPSPNHYVPYTHIYTCTESKAFMS